MNTTNIVRVPSADVFPRVEQAKWNGLMHHISHETLCERLFISLTISMSTFLSYVCYHALQHYGVM